MIAFSRLEISFIENGFINNFRIIQRGPFKGWAMVPSNNQKHDASVFTVFDFNKGFEFEKDVFSFDIQIQDEKAEFYSKSSNAIDNLVTISATLNLADKCMDVIATKSAERNNKIEEQEKSKPQAKTIAEKTKTADLINRQFQSNISDSDFAFLDEMPKSFWSVPEIRSSFSALFFDGLDKMRMSCEDAEDLIALHSCGIDAGNNIVSFMQKVIENSPTKEQELSKYQNENSEFDVTCREKIDAMKISNDATQLK